MIISMNYNEKETLSENDKRKPELEKIPLKMLILS